MDMQTNNAAGVPERLNLKEVARHLDVHYMTAYRYVRQGRLTAQQIGGMWFVEQADLDEFVRTPDATTRADVDWAGRLAEHLRSGDEVAAWTVLREAADAGQNFEALHLDVLTGALGRLSEDPASNSVVDHRIALALATRLVARLGARVSHRGRKLGTVVLATPAGEHHGLGIALVANLVGQAGFRVLSLGTDVPVADVLTVLDRIDTPIAFGMSVTTIDVLPSAGEMAAAILDTHPELPVLIGGQAVRNAEVAALAGATAWSDGPELVETLRTLAAANRSSRRRAAAKAR